jgi:hypothetical protein
MWSDAVDRQTPGIKPQSVHVYLGQVTKVNEIRKAAAKAVVDTATNR